MALQLISPWTQPSRTAIDDGGGAAAIVLIYLVLFGLCIVVGGTLLAARNLRAGRGDRAGALRLATVAVAALWLLWLCQVHVTPSIGMIAAFFLAVVTTAFYGLFFWTIYLALEPFVRRHWPQTLVSWTTLLRGRIGDPVVGRDVLLGMSIGVLIAILIKATALYQDTPIWTDPALLLGVRSVAGHVVMQVIYAARSALFLFYLLFLFRVLLRNQWAAGIVFVLLFSVIDALDSDTPLLEGATTFLYFSMLAAAVLRWGLVTLTTAMLVASLLLISPATLNPSAWTSAPVQRCC